MSKLMRVSFKLLDLIVIFVMTFGSPMSAAAYVWTDPTDYPPGSEVWIQGDNSNGVGYIDGETVHVNVTGPNDENGVPYSASCDAVVMTPDPLNRPGYLYWTCFVTLWDSPYAQGEYTYIAAGLTSGVQENGMFTDAPGDIDKVYKHWADQIDQPGGPAWQNDILSANKSDYFEGEVIPHVFVYKASNQEPLTYGQTYAINVTYNYYQANTNAGGFAFMTTYNISRQPGPLNATNPYIPPTMDDSFVNGGGMQGVFYTVDADITNVSNVTYLGTGTKDGYVTITFTYTGATTTNGIAEIYYGLYVAEPGMVPDQGTGTTRGAHAWTGGSLQTTVDIGGSGATSIQLSPSAIIVGQISGVKFNDLDGDGVKDSGEPLLSGWTIQLCADSACTIVLDTTTTGANGAYAFSVTPDADKTDGQYDNDPYYVRESNQSGWLQTAPSVYYYGPLLITATTPQYSNQNFGNRQGYLKITKVFNPLTSGFNGTFAIVYNCGAGDQTVNLAAGASTTVGPFAIGTSCTVSEPTLPTPPAGWTFGSPTFSPASTVIIDSSNTVISVNVTNSISLDQGYLKITKAFDPMTSGFTGKFNIKYNCGAGDQTVQLGAGEFTTVGPFLIGTSCTVSEPALPTAPVGWTFGTPSISPAQPVTINSTTTPVEVTVTNTISRDLGSLKIMKSFDPRSSGFTGKFSINYDCDGTAFDGTVELGAGEDATISNIPTGTSCTVSEPILPTAPTGWTFGTPSISPTQPVTINSTTTPVEVTVTNSITRDLGSLTIHKSLSNPDNAPVPATFKVNYDCGTGYTGQVEVAPNGDAIVNGIPTGSTCTVTEVAPTPIPDYTWGTITYTPESVTIDTQGGVFTITVGNSITRDRGSLKISKTLSNPDGAPVPASFTVNYDCGTGYTGQVTVGTESPATIPNIPTGSVCTVTEVAPAAIPGYSWGVITYTPDSVTISTKDTTFEITVGNSISRDRGSLKITKHTENLDGATLPAAFTGTYDCGGTYTGSFSVANDASQTFSGIPTGSVCTVTETTPAAIPGYTWGAISYSPTSVTIVKDATLEIVVNNSITRDRGSLKISKTLTNLDGAPVPASFLVDYNCGNGYTGQVSVAPNSPATVNGIPTGSVCSVTEVAPAVIPGYTWGTITYSPDSVIIESKAGTFEIIVGNSITRDRGNLKLSKSLVGGPTDYVGPFQINYDCDGTAYDGFVMVEAGSFETVTGIPTGTQCTISETLPTPPAGYAFGAPTFAPSATVTITTRGATVEVTTTNTMSQDLVVTKTAVPSFTRTWDWTIEKIGDATYNLFAGDSVTHNYQVTVTPTATDSAWKVIGTITISNPNAWQAIEANVADAVDNGGTCALNDPTQATVSVPAGGSVNVDYTCTWTTRPTAYAGTNTATVTWDQDLYTTPNGLATGPRNFEFTNPTEINPVITVDDDKLMGETWTADRAYAEWTYTTGFSCSTDPANYAGDGKYDSSLTNTATINETTGDHDSATVTVNCYAPVVSKTAAGTYDERHEWNVEKTVSPVLQSAFIGDTVSYEWKVDVTESVTEETFKVAGEISVVNPAPMEMIVDLFDELGGGTDAVIGTCTDGTYAAGKLSIPADTTAVCAYTVVPNGRTDTINNVTATLNGINFDASATFEWAANVIRGSAILDDDQNPDFPQTLTEAGTFTYAEQFTCSTNKTLYEGDNTYSFGESNTATLTFTVGDPKTSTASTNINCYVPTISKSANGTYDEVHDWEVYKTGAAAQKKFAGQSAGFQWTVRVDETVHAEDFLVTGQITVTNPNPEDPLAITLNDVLSDGSVASITTCTGGTWTDPTLAIPAGSTATCDYTVIPTGDLAQFAQNLPDTVTMKVDYPEPNDPAYFELVTVTGGGALNGTYEGWCVDQDHTIAQNTNYTAFVYSSYESLPANLLEHPENLDLVNWILNQDYVYNPAGGNLGVYTYGDVQRAIWELIDDTPFSTSGLNGWNQTRVNQIKAAAIANGEGFVPTAGNFVAVILVPYAGQTLQQSVTIARVWLDPAPLNTATAELNGIHFDASAQIQWTINPVNPTATLDDTQNPSWPTTVSDDATFTYNDPQGYVCPSDPVAYAGDGIAPVYTDTNTATISYTGGSRSSTASTQITCYGPIVSKTAATEWRKKYDWTITKTADPASHIGFAGDTFTSAYDVFVDQTITDYGYKATGTISIKNPSGSPAAMSIDVADMISGGFAATVDCDPNTAGDQSSVSVPVNTIKTCTYTAGLPDNTSRVNTATATLNSIGFPATANVVFGNPIIEGYPTINVTDNVQGALGSTSGDQHFTYERTFSCSNNPADYTGYADTDTYGNTATITETTGSANASVQVDCYIPEISKTAAGAYGERHEWDVEKTVTPASQDVFAGGTVSYEWKVVVTEEVFEENFAVEGTITVVNHNPEDAMTVTLSDVVNGNTAVISSCTGDDDLANGLTIAKGESSVCNYSAILDLHAMASAPTSNTATATLNSLAYTASTPIVWTPTITRGSATLTDDQIGLNESITNAGIFTGSESYSCSTSASDYANAGTYTFSEHNTAIVTSDGAEEDRSTATETINCYGPVISKTAAGAYDERHEWDVEKTVDPTAQSGFAGDTLPFNWTITVTESVFEENFNVTGTITVLNPAPMAMTVDLADVLDVPAAVTINPGPDCDFADGKLTIPMNGTATCGYTVDPAGRTAALNSATATLNGINFVATYPIEWTANVIRGEAELTDIQGPLNETITGSGTWTVNDSFTCSTDTTKYTENYSYTDTIWNTAKVTSGDYQKDSTTSTTFTCFVPEMHKTAAGAYDERHEWDVNKTVSPESQSAFAGDTVSYEWTVTVEEDIFEENFVASGQITIVNHNVEDAMIVAISDVLSDDTTATITACTGDTNLSDGLTIAVGGTSVCDYTAALTYNDVDNAPTNNTATAVLNGVSYTAFDAIEWTPNIIRGSATLDDDQSPNLPPTISDGGTWQYSESYQCSTDKTQYEGDNTYTFGESNTATVKHGETTLDSSTASNTINCYVPTISKTADGTYDEVHDWEVFKSVNTASQTAFAGEQKNFTWTVRVDETTHGENYQVTGTITVVNPNPEDALTVALDDTLNDGSIAVIGPCSGGTWSSPNLTVPAGGTATCDYTVTPQGDLAQFAAALPATVTINSANPGPDSYWLTTVSNDAALNGVYESWCVDIDHTMNPGQNYTATVYSSYESYPSGLIEKPENMDLVNWIINQNFVGQSTGSFGNFTYGDVQRAIWELIEDNPTATTAGLGAWNQNRVNLIKAAATANGNGFTPMCGDFVAVLLVPTGGQQPIALAQVTFASLGISCADSNVATAVLNGVEFPASTTILWDVNKINEIATLDDDQKSDWPTTVSADTTFTYPDPQGYSCSTDPAAYTNGFYQYNESNTALLTYQTGSDSATASTAVRCYAPVVSKTAAGVYDERHEWDVFKSVSPPLQDVLAGQTANFDWTVSVTESVTEENFAVTGNINIRNPRTDAAMVVTLNDVINDNTAATITGCTVGTWNGTNHTVSIPANSTAVCSYTVAPGGRTATLNTATVGLNSLTTTATANVGWTPNVIRGSATLDDDQNPDLPPTITDGGTWTYEDSYTCSTNQGDYSNGSYTHSEYNTATVTSGDKSASADANTAVTCHAPVVTKTAETYFNRDWDWTVTKVQDATYNLFAGGSVTHDYKVTVDPTYTDNFWGVKGTITIANTHPTEGMLLFSLSDNAGGITGNITCPNPILTIPANDSITCTYDTGPQTAPNAKPFGDTNTATAVFAGANWTGTAPIEFSEEPTTENEPVITVDDDNLTGEVWSADRASAEWTYSKDFACSTNPDDYADGKDSYSLTNTATINQTGQTDTATVNVNCYAPKVTKTAETYWNRDWDWIITKGFDAVYSLFAGDTVTHDYTVTVDPNYEDNFWGVKGNITVYNYHPTQAMTLASLTDLAGGINGNVTCESLVVPANDSITCTYDTGEQDSPDDNPFGDLNTATAAFAGANWTGTYAILFSDTPTTEDEPVITVDDNNLTGEEWTADRAAGEWTYNKDFACPTDTSLYTDGVYIKTPHVNTATINETDQNDTATVNVTCYAPVVTKTAAGAYDERHEWDVEKSVIPSTQKILLGKTGTFDWTVDVTEKVFEENFVASGEIFVTNPRPETGDMVVKLTDVLSDTNAATITGCTNGTWDDVNQTVTVAPNTTATCAYTAGLTYTDNANAPTSNTVTAELLVGTTHLITTASDAVEWNKTVIRGNATLTDEQKPLDEPLTGHPQVGTYTFAPFTYGGSYTCPENKELYTNGYYKETISNTAIVTSGDERDRDTASTVVNCYYPIINIDKKTQDMAVVNGIPGDDINVLTGEPIKWIYTVTNPGSVPLSNVSVTDNMAGVTPVYKSGDTNNDGKLDTDETWIYEATGVAVTGQYNNIGKATGDWTDDNNNTDTAEDTDISSYFGADPQINIVKKTQDMAEPNGTPNDGDNILIDEPIKWIYTVTNTGNVPLSNVTVTDSVAGVTVTCPQTTLAVNESMDCTATGTSAIGTYSNTGTASGSYTDDAGHSRTHTATDGSRYFGANPQIKIVKTTKGTDGSIGDNVFVLVGGEVIWYYEVTNVGNVPLANVTVTDNQGVTPAFVSGDTNNDGLLDLTETWLYSATGTNSTPAGSWYRNTGTATGSYTDTARHTRTPTSSDPSGYYSGKTGDVTNSQLCNFGPNFRLVFTPDSRYYTSSYQAYKLSDSNPGQFFYNLFYTNDGTTDTFTLEIPYPFVTQGAMPVHVYDGLTVNPYAEGTPSPDNLVNCYEPGTTLAAYDRIITLNSYTDTNHDNKIGFGDVVTVDVPAELGFQYINIHLDYGLEKTDGWVKNGSKAITDQTKYPGRPDILDAMAHTFKAYADGALIPDSEDTIYNQNEFKQVRGFGGMVYIWDSTQEQYVAVRAARVKLYKGTTLTPANLKETMTSDGDGWYLSTYVHTGRSATYTLALLDANGNIIRRIQVTAGGSLKFGEGIFRLGGPTPTP